MHAFDSSLPRALRRTVPRPMPRPLQTLPKLPRLALLTAALALGSATPGLLWAQAAAPSSPRPDSTLSDTPVMGLEQLTRLVLQHNPELQAALQARQTAAAGVTSAGALPNPRLEVSGGHNSARLPSANPGQVQTWAVSQLIENPALRSARQDAARAGVRGSAEQAEITRQALIAQVQLRAYEALLRQAEAASASESLALLEQVRERVRLRVDSGEAPRYEIIKADAEIINARQRQQSAALQAEQALPGLPVLRAQADERNPELRALQAEIQRAQARLAEARASRWPGLELRYSQTRDPEIRQNQLGVSMQIPLLDTRSGPRAEAESELLRLQGRLDGRRAELGQQVLLAWKSLELARGRTEALSQGAVREAEAALRVAQAAYRYGERGILDVLDAQRVLRSVRADLLDARYQQQVARIELELLAGRHGEAELTPPVTPAASATPQP